MSIECGVRRIDFPVDSDGSFIPCWFPMLRKWLEVHLLEGFWVLKLFGNNLDEVLIKEALDCENQGISFLLFVTNTGNQDVYIHLLPCVAMLECSLLREVFSVKPPGLCVGVVANKLLGVPCRVGKQVSDLV